MVFETKKIKHETLSEYLTEVRNSLHLSQEEVAEKTSISLKFLMLLERGSFGSLPADVYVYGFLKQLARMYAVDADSLIDQFKKEKGIERQILKTKVFDPRHTVSYFGKVIITPKYLSLLLGISFVVVTIGYIIWQILSINKAPSLDILKPEDRQIVHQSFVNVSGKTDSGATLTINDQNVFVDNNGNFSTQLGVGDGSKDLVFVAKNKFEKTTSKTLSVIGQITTPAVMDASATPAVILKLNFTDSVTLTFKIDSQEAQTLQFQSGDTKILTAQNKVIISTSNAGATQATFNNQSLGVLGKPGENLQNLPFSGTDPQLRTEKPK